MILLNNTGCVKTQVSRPGFSLNRKALFNKIEASKVWYESRYDTVTLVGGIFVTNAHIERILIEGPKSDATKALDTLESAMDLLKSGVK